MEKKILSTIILILLLLQGCSYLPEPAASGTGVVVNEHRDYIQILPQSQGTLSKTGLLFYPGGFVDPHAYIDLCSQFAISGQGHEVIIAKMPANLAVLDATAAKRILSTHTDKDWIIGGHSLGGVMACSCIASDTTLFKGLLLLASYPASSNDLSTWTRPVISITATNDRELDFFLYESAKPLLPSSTEYLSITGGNHSGFGDYGFQKGDGIATTTNEQQQTEIINQLQLFYTTHGLE